MDILLFFFLDYHLVYGSYSSDNTPEGLNDISVGDGQDIGGWGWPRLVAMPVVSLVCSILSHILTLIAAVLRGVLCYGH